MHLLPCLPISAPKSPPPKSQDLTGRVTKESKNYSNLGQNSDIWYALWEDSPIQGVLVVVKVIRGAVSPDPEFTSKFREKLRPQLHLWTTLDHPNIAEIYGMVDNFGTLPGIVMKKYPESLRHRVALHNEFDNDDVKLKWVKDIALGLKFLHRQKPPVLHGDLRCANVFLDAGRCVLADFGLVFLIDASEFTSVKTAGSSRWTAPEIMDPKAANEHDPYHDFSTASDAFSLAMIIIEIFTGGPPFSKKKNDSAVIFAIAAGKRPDIPQNITSNHYLSNVVRKCWQQNPKSRPSMSWVCYQLGLTSAVMYAKEWLGLM
ncbi:kinase-like protein [Coprinopsis marcescibilis]|uniref:Kinase-like protein n=1 Tax=Coprinopsis marcescibilis TaxID=230819 RepID=A0A5C3KQ14_COPMA|nr:kinase-like protein [Coprinopsis marcescibilis]